MNRITKDLAGLALSCTLLPATGQAQDNAEPVPMSMEQEQAMRDNPVKCARPAYPKGELRAEHKGTVKIAFLIDVDGMVRESKVVSSTGYPALDDAGVRAILKCQ
ncbi:MAG TPA: TonB family protein, partial [Telluria sp.]|nr:TonB family protein [Telluria sp.]